MKFDVYVALIGKQYTKEISIAKVSIKYTKYINRSCWERTVGINNLSAGKKKPGFKHNIFCSQKIKLIPITGTQISDSKPSMAIFMRYGSLHIHTHIQGWKKSPPCFCNGKERGRRTKDHIVGVGARLFRGNALFSTPQRGGGSSCNSRGRTCGHITLKQSTVLPIGWPPVGPSQPGKITLVVVILSWLP